MSTESIPQRDASAAEALAEHFAVFGPAFVKWLHAGSRDSGITFPRLRLLHVLHTDGPQIMSSLGDRLGVTARNVTALVDGLEDDGLAQRTAHPKDRRATVVQLTPRGQRAAADHFTAHRVRAAGLFERLSPADQRELLRLVQTLIGVLREAGADEGCALHLPDVSPQS